MEKKKWIDLINENIEKLQDVCEEAYKRAMHNRDLEYRVVLSLDGEISTHQDQPNGMHETIEEFESNAIVIAKFCCFNDNIIVTDEDMRNKLTENNIIVPVDMCEDELYNLMKEKYSDLYKECERENIEANIDAYAYDIAGRAIDDCIENFPN